VRGEVGDAIGGGDWWLGVALGVSRGDISGSWLNGEERSEMLLLPVLRLRCRWAGGATSTGVGGLFGGFDSTAGAVAVAGGLLEVATGSSFFLGGAALGAPKALNHALRLGVALLQSTFSSSSGSLLGSSLSLDSGTSSLPSVSSGFSSSLSFSSESGSTGGSSFYKIRRKQKVIKMKAIGVERNKQSESEQYLQLN